MTYERVMQVGLFETDPEAVKVFAERIANFNQRYASNIVLDVQPSEKGDAQYPGGPHFKLRLTFPNHDVQEAFWME